MISYAQNFEDVMLWRALKHVEKGNYIDIGAQDPLIDSVSLAFHELGWRGIHIEPTPHYAELLRQQRPGDTVIQAAVGNGPAVLRFFEIPDTGISTADPAIAQQHRERGFDVQETTVPCIALSAIFDTCPESDIHWLKIDVEGFEKQVLTSWGKSRARPWIVVVESTLPMTRIETHETWESILTSYGYSPIYFDGLNRFYISDTHPELKNAFNAPPNVFDGFTLNGTASTPLHHLIETRYTQQINEILAQTEQQKSSADNEIERLSLNLDALDKALNEHERSRMQREQEISTQLMTIQKQAAAENTELNQQHQKHLEDIQRQRAEHEWLTAERIHTLNQSLHHLQADNAMREQAHADIVNSLQKELVTVLRIQTQREQEIAAQLLALQQEKTEESRNHNAQKLLLMREHAEREHVLNQQFLAGQQELHRLEQDRVEREQKHAEHTRQIQQSLENLQRAQTQHEQENAEQLLAMQQQSHREIAEQSKKHDEQLNALQRKHVELEQTLSQQLQAKQHQLHNLEQTRADMQHQLNAQLQAEREASQQLQQVLTTLQAELATLRNSLFWRLTAPLRAVAGWFKPAPEQTGHVIGAAEQPVVATISHLDPYTGTPDTQELTFNRPLSETTSMTSNFTAETPHPTLSSTTPNLNVLLRYQDHEFVEFAYLSILKRLPDAEGLNYYLGRLRSGVPKIQILGQLLDSDEALKSGVDLSRLHGEVQRQKLIQLPLISDVIKYIHYFTMKRIPYVELANFNGNQFVENCYLRLLHRQADPSGRAHYLSQLESGEDKAIITEDILRSDEGRRVGEQVSGLWMRSIRARMETWPVLGSFIPIQTREISQKLRGIDNQLHRLIKPYDTLKANCLAAPCAEVAVVISPSPTPQSLPMLPKVSLAKSNRPSIFLVVDATSGLTSERAQLIAHLGRAFVAQGEPILFILWNTETRNFQLVTRRDLDQFELTSVMGDAVAVYPVNSEIRTVIEPALCGADDWLFVPNTVRISADSPHLIEMDMIMEAKRLGLGAGFVFHGAEPLRLKKIEGNEAEAHEQYMQALLLADAIIPTSTFASKDLAAFFVQHQKADSAPLIEEIPLPGENLSDTQLPWSDYAKKVRVLLADAADKSHHIHTLYFWIDRATMSIFAWHLAGALSEHGVALIPIIWDTENKRFIYAEGECPDCSKHAFASFSWAEWIAPGVESAPQWVLRPDEAPGELLVKVSAFAKANVLRIAAVLSDANEHQSDEDFPPPTAQDQHMFESLAGIDKVFATTERRLRQFHHFLLSWRGKTHSAEHRFKTIVSPNKNLGPEEKSWSDYAKEIAIELATDRLIDGLRPVKAEADADVYATLVNLRKRPKLSLCISTYNRGGWVEINLRNIFTQIATPRDDLEILVVDNTSVDHTPDVVKPYLARPDFSYVRNPKNVGMLGNLAVTAQRAKGEYIWILGDDDLTRPGTIEKVLQIIEQHPGIGLIYMNYGYTSEANPGNVTDLTSFLANYNMLEPGGPDEFAPVKRLAAKCENFFTAIYSHVYRRDHALKSYCQDTSGRIFSTMLSCVPTAYYVLNYMADEPAYWIGEPSLVVNSNVSWQDYGVLLDLEQLPRTWDLAERMGTASDEVDRRRANRLWLVEMMWKEIFENDKVGNSAYFSASRVLMRLKHLTDIDKHIPEFISIYERARMAGHPAATMPADELFSAFNNLPSSHTNSNSLTP
ncbi:MAG: FkbM family methyltransferase [Burkholderiales bacterium]